MNSLTIDWDADTAYPVTLATIKDVLRIDHDEFDAQIMEVHLPQAVNWAEGEARRSIMTKTHRWVLKSFPVGAFRLPRGKTQSVASIAYVNGGSTTTLTGPSSGSPEGTGYQEDLRGEHGGLLMPNANESWPSNDLDVPAPIVITFDAGWTFAQVPGEIRMAICFAVRDSLELGDTTDMDVKDKLISGWRTARW